MEEKKLKKMLGKNYNRIKSSLGDEMIDKTIRTFKGKGFDNHAISCVLDYLSCNKLAFGDSGSININEVADRLSKNLTGLGSKDDTGGSILDKLKRLRKSGGHYSMETGYIYTNPIRKLRAMFSSKRKLSYDSVLRHEIDHCATTSNGVHGKISGFSSASLAKANGLDAFIDSNNRFNSLDSLNEGITSYKQKKYDEAVYGEGKSPTDSKNDGYRYFREVVAHIADIVGEKEVLQAQANGDYAILRESYKQKTGKDLNDIVKKMNSFYLLNSKQRYAVMDEKIKEFKDMTKDMSTGKVEKVSKEDLAEYHETQKKEADQKKERDSETQSKEVKREDGKKLTEEELAQARALSKYDD